MQVTDFKVIDQAAIEIMQILHAHGIRKREVEMVMNTVNALINDQPVLEVMEYPNSK